MKLYEIRGSTEKAVAFEVSSLHLRRANVVQVVRMIPGSKVIRSPRVFNWWRDQDDEFCEFEVEGVRFVAWEPWGDSSRFWVGPKVEDGQMPTWCPQMESIKATFQRAFPLFGFLFWREYK